MHAEPINDRINQLLTGHRATVIKLVNSGWTDGAIAGYLRSDRITVKRVRKLVESGLA